MRYHVLATDYDGTLAHDGAITDETELSLKQLRESGRKVVLVTGRELDELLALIPTQQMLFDRIVAENGALVYTPETRAIRLLAPPPPPAFAAELTRRGCERVASGRVIVATWEPHQTTVLEVIRDQGLELQVIFNKGAVMVLPSGVNKATGLAAALADLHISPRNVVAVGDAENDHALLAMSECAVAVSNALPALKDKADVLTRGARGQGVSELIAGMLRDDLRAAAPLLRRRRVLLGQPVDAEREPVQLDPYATNIMVCGTSGSGKSTLTTGLLERLATAGYQFVIIDPEGDFSTHEHAVVLGGPQRAPLVEEVLDVLKDPARSVVVNMLGTSLEHRPEFAVKLLPALADLRARTGRPHWLVVDEAHHLLPASWSDAVSGVGFRPHGCIYITVHPGSVAAPVLATINTVLAVGAHPDATVKELCDAAGHDAPPPAFAGERLPTGDVLYWHVGERDAVVVRTEPPQSERQRHGRKYSEGNLGRDRSFYFKGATGKLNLKAQNLQVFLQLADGIDDETWSWHLERNDYSKWLRVEVKDPVLADEVEIVEADLDLLPAESRAAVRTAIEKRYTLPVDKASGVIDPTEELARKQGSGQPPVRST